MLFINVTNKELFFQIRAVSLRFIWRDIQRSTHLFNCPGYGYKLHPVAGPLLGRFRGAWNNLFIAVVPRFTLAPVAPVRNPDTSK